MKSNEMKIKTNKNYVIIFFAKRKRNIIIYTFLITRFVR